MRRVYIIVAAAVLLLALGGGAWYYYSQNGKSDTTDNSKPSDSKKDDASDSDSPSGDTSKPSGQNGQSENQTYQVSVYFSKHPESDDDPSAVFAVPRKSPDLGVAVFSIKELLKGPSAAEADLGYFSTAQLRDGTGTDDFKITIKDGTATLQFLRQFDHRGVVADGQAESELKATLKQFPSVQKVVILNPSGNCEFDLSGLNKCLE